MTQRHKTKFPELGEFQFIKKLLERQTTGGAKFANPELRLGVGDDCAQLDRWLISTDMSVENVHFRLDWSSPEQAVEKTVLSNLSDLNAMGSEVRYALLGLCLSKQWDAKTCERVGLAFAESLERHGVEMIGGDTVRGAVGCFSLTVFGDAPEGKPPLLRSAAVPGDYIYVSGMLGASAAGLHILLEQPSDRDKWPVLVNAHLVPEPPLGLGRQALQYGAARAAIDISDGLSSELHHIAVQSSVCMAIEECKVPVHPDVLSYCRLHNLDSRSFWMNGGEEYQLIFTSSREPSLLVLPKGSFPVRCIGRVEQGHGVKLLRADSVWEEIEPKAWSHL